MSIDMRVETNDNKAASEDKHSVEEKTQIEPRSDLPVFFISHRHDDKDIADAFRKSLQTWVDDPDTIFQSSHPTSGLTFGADIKRQLVEQLFETDVFILLYTDPGADWQYCVWEYGVAMSPDSDKTRFVIFEFNDHPKGFFEDILTVKVHDPNEVHRFVTELLAKKNFIPGHDPLKPKWTDEMVVSDAHELYERLRGTGRVEGSSVNYRYGVLQLTLDKDSTRETKELKESGNKEAALQKLGQALSCKDVNGNTYRHFGYSNEPDQPQSQFSRFVNSWQEFVEKDASTEWHEELLEQFYRALDKLKADPIITPFKSMHRKIDYRLIIPKWENRPDGSMGFDVLFYPLAEQSEE